jgi:phage terminase Nu1 subunit (DNA packaging protein)
VKLDDDATCTATELAWLLGCTDRAIRGYAARGLAVRAGKRGRYALGESTRRIHRHVAEAAAGRSGTGLADARTKLALSQTAAQELRNASLRGEMIPKIDAIDTWRVLLRGVRQFVMALPGKIAFEVPTLTAADRSTVERICRDDLADAALGRGFDIGGGGAEVNDAGPEGKPS